jgi:hypothetical protein
MRRVACFEAGRKTLTQSSATANRCSRKWMSGHVTALAEQVNQQQIAAKTDFTIAQRDPCSPGTGKPPFSLDKYLSWMSPNLVSGPFLDWGLAPKLSYGSHSK